MRRWRGLQSRLEPSLVPLGELQTGFSSAPELHAAGVDAGYDTQAPGLRVEGRVFQKAAYELRSLPVVHIELHQRIMRMAKEQLEEILVMREEGRPWQSVQQGSQILVGSAAG